MTLQIISSDDTDGIVVANDTELTILEGVVVSNGQSSVITTSETELMNVDINLLGTIVSGSDGLDLYYGAIATTDEINVFVGETGTIIAERHGMLFDGPSDISITNLGLLRSTNDVIQFNTLASNVSIVNAGTMSSEEAVFFISSGTGTAFINNSGTMLGDGDLNDETIESLARIVVTNTGLIAGFNGFAIGASSEDDIVRNYGTIDGSVDLGSGDNRINNTGIITGDVSTGFGFDTFFNSGTFEGDLSMEDADDTYRALGDGVVLGTIDGGLGEDIIIGGSETDEAYGGADADIMNGLGGDDFLYGELGNDTMRGGEGDDLLYGGEDNDLVYGNDGDDILDGGIGDDTLNAGAGNDDVFGGDGEDVMFAGFGSDRLYGGKDNDILNGFIGGADSFADTLVGADGDDRIFAGNGADTLNAGNGDDTLSGGAGDDRIIGGFDGDLMTGGSGEDDFVFLSTGHSTLANGDVITDFTSGEDTLIVLALNLDAFIGTAAFSGSGDGEIRYGVVGSDVAVIIDADGNGTADMRFYLEDINSVAADDFLF